MRKKDNRVCKKLCNAAHCLGMTQDDMARIAGITTVTLRTRIYGAQPFTMDEAYSLAQAMGITPAQFTEYFPDRRRHACGGR